MERAKRFVLERRIAPLPIGERLEILDTPVFDRSALPYAAYQAPAPFDADPAGVFYVTPIDIRRPKDEQAAQLGAHCTPELPIIALHEGYPGHHLQMCHANKAATRLRRIVHSDVFAEGWALYCEELMWEQGYFTADPLTRLFQLRDLLFRACRVVLDASLHSGRMSPEQAVEYLVEEAMLGPSLATQRGAALLHDADTTHELPGRETPDPRAALGSAATPRGKIPLARLPCGPPRQRDDPAGTGA